MPQKEVSQNKVRVGEGNVAIIGAGFLMELQDYEITRILDENSNDLDAYDFQLIQDQGFAPTEIRLEDAE